MVADGVDEGELLPLYRRQAGTANRRVAEVDALAEVAAVVGDVTERRVLRVSA